MRERLFQLYSAVTVQRPWLGGGLVLLGFIAALWHAQSFRLDASADSLVLEGDSDLAYYDQVTDRYGSSEFLVVTYTPDGELFADETLQTLKRLRDDLAAIEGISEVTSILDVPLIESPPISLAQIAQGANTLLDPETDRELARKEFRTSPLYKNLLTSQDEQTTALQATLTPAKSLAKLDEQRTTLRAQAAAGDLADTEELAAVEDAYKAASAARQDDLARLVGETRAVLDGYRDNATIFLGGVPMIAVDMINFVRKDIQLFSLVVGGIMILLLAIAFRRVRWVFVPVAICVVVNLSLVGLLGFMSWPVTVVSSNFTALTLIITLSLTVHLVVRHLELHADNPDAKQPWLLDQTLRSKFAPSVFTTLTTMVSFGSLIIADIRPVIDFGLMMVCGVLLALLIAMLLYPALLAPMGAGTPSISREDFTAKLTRGMANTIERFGTPVLLVYGVLIVAAAVGISRLGVENRFIDYFDSETEIYQGLVQIDKKLGGTTPLEVIINAPAQFLEEDAEYRAEFPDSYAAGGLSANSYWYNTTELERVGEIHDYLDSLPETGKVLSMGTTADVFTSLNGGSPLSNFLLAIVYKKAPADIKQALFDPYLSDDGNQLRFSIRVIDSDKNLNRNALLNKIRSDLTSKFDLAPEQIRLAGLLVLYNNVLQSLFESQILTLGTVFVVILIMLSLLFRSIPLALIGITPTLFAASVILGLMGWLGIPLDIMTITIAAITIGIGVDNTIHYTHRFVEELRNDPDRGDYWVAIRRTHGSVGRAIYYTSVIVTVGFAMLALSNFVPIIYFGLFTGLAMVLALVANLTLLPLLFAKFKPIRLAPK